MVEDVSTMTESTDRSADPAADPADGIHTRIAQRVRDLRAARSLSLEALAQASGVSRSMISLIERAESSPTAVVLERLAMGLGVSLASLFDAPEPSASPVSRRAAQALWQDPHSGYVRRNVSPAGVGSPLQIVEVQFPPKARVAYETGPRDPVVHQQIWVLEGRIEVTVGTALHKLEAGDCLALVLDQPLSYFNPTRQVTRYAVILTSPAFARQAP
jgi:transcriptional regulator with XRE-family HTH domain